MNKEDMIQALVSLYDRRLRKLLYYDQEAYTRQLIERMFQRFDELTEQGHRCYALQINAYISSILGHNEEYDKQTAANLALHEIRSLLELYIKSTIIEFWPEEKNNLDALNPKHSPIPQAHIAPQAPQATKAPKAPQATKAPKAPRSKDPLDYRALLGRKLRECQEKHPSLFPEELNLGVLIQQLKHITEVRNEKIHTQKVGLTTLFKRYTFLGAYSTLLGYILYTYYHLKLEEARKLEAERGQTT